MNRFLGLLSIGIAICTLIGWADYSKATFFVLVALWCRIEDYLEGRDGHG